MPTRLPGEGACTTYAALTVDLVGTKIRKVAGVRGRRTGARTAVTATS